MSHSPPPREQGHARPEPAAGPDPSAIEGPWQVTVREQVASTNSEARALAAQGASHLTVVTTTNQTAGRGRLTRAWVTPPGAALSTSVVLVPPDRVPAQRWPWLSLLTGLAVHDALEVLGVRAGLKWPNDVLVEDRKICGILVERVDRTGLPPAAVVGVGLNTAAGPGDLPPTGTSLRLLGAPTDPTTVLSTLLAALLGRYEAWLAAGADPAGGDGALLADYRAASTTIDTDVRVHLPRDAVLEGRCVDVDAAGHLVVEVEGRRHQLGVGDVVHVRAGGAAGSRPVD
ncbi:biotin--[acetyl-CoA-carboxylase] ligase [Nocardioidaceae bacterium]|nr:biotin--[acetyl-CoA-carboxylase] ligase [Nocardioidaceae bacterium]